MSAVSFFLADFCKKQWQYASVSEIFEPRKDVFFFTDEQAKA